MPTDTACDIFNSTSSHQDPLHSIVESEEIGDAPEAPRNANRNNTGRISDANHIALQKFFDQVDGLFDTMGKDLGYAPERVIQLWLKAKGRTVISDHRWNKYQTYFSINPDREMVRAGFNPKPLKDITQTEKSSCYSAFRRKYSDEAVTEILSLATEVSNLAPMGTTFASRQRDFGKYKQKVVQSVSFFKLYLCIHTDGILA
jgi:hypothetical protein